MKRQLFWLKMSMAITLFFLSSFLVVAQTDRGNYPTLQGAVTIIPSMEVEALNNKYIHTCKNKKTERNGYRIQILQAMKSDPVLKAKADILRNYPQHKVYYTYDQPDFKLRVGDFTDRYAVQKAYSQIRKQFPGAFIVRDEVNLIR